MDSFEYKKSTIKYTVVGQPNENALVMIHGTQTCGSHCFGNVYNTLCNSYQLFVLETPGFGISGFPIHDFKDVFEEYSLIIKTLITTVINKQSVHLLGHSFGGILCVHFSSQYPSYVKSLVLTSLPGILPIMNNYGYLWGMYFKYYPLQKSLSCIRPLVMSLAESFSKNVTFWNAISSGDCIGPDILASQFCIDKKSCYWRKPILHKLLSLQVPLSFIWGEDDCIISYHQAVFTLKLFDSDDIPLYVIRNVGHNPFREMSEKMGSKIIYLSIKNAALAGPLSQNVAETIKDENFEWAKTSLSFSKNETVTNNLYEFLGTKAKSTKNGNIIFICERKRVNLKKKRGL